MVETTIPEDGDFEEPNNGVDLELCLLHRFSSETSTPNSPHPFEFPSQIRSGLQAPEAWTTQGEFKKQEMFRRKANGDQEKERIMISHCWRDESTQQKKRRIISHLSKPTEEGGGGLAYWADYLDLQTEGPVPWRREIEDGIRACSKFVAFVDRAYLTSFNCLQELAIACMFGKPLVVIVLTEEAWNLLTLPGGAGEAKAEADAAASSATAATDSRAARLQAAAIRHGISSKVAWESVDFGPPLFKYEGCDVVSGEPMSMEVVQKLFTRLSAVNMCPCRLLEEKNSGWDSMLAMALTFVAKDLVYNKEHAQLMNKADAWESSVKRNLPQPLLQEAEAASWSQWVARADKYSLEPRPTAAMKALVKASLRYSSVRRRTLRLLAIGFVFMLIAGVAASSVLALEAERRAEEAQDLKALAEMRTREAEAAEARAIDSSMQATAAKARAIDSSRQATALLGKDFVTSGVTYANEVRLKVLREMLARLPSNTSASVNATILAAGNALLQLPYAYTEQVIQWDKGGIGSVAWSHDGRTLAVLSSDGSALQMFEVHSHTISNSPTQDLSVQGCPGTSLAWAPDRPLLAHACDGTVDNSTAVLMLWSRGLDGTMELAQRVPTAHNKTVLSVAWSPDGRFLASGSADTTVQIWPFEEVRREEDKEGVFPTLLLNGSGSVVLQGHDMGVNGVAWSPDSRSVASASTDSTVRIWSIMGDADDGLPGLAPEPQVLRGRGGGYVLSVAWSSGNMLASAHSFDNSVRLWTVGSDGTFGSEPTEVRNNGQSYRVVSLAWSLDGKSLAAASDGFTVRIWPALGDVRTLLSSPAASLRGHSGRCTDIAWSPHGQRLVSSSADGTLRVWTAGSTGTASPKVIDGACDVAWSPDGRIIAAPIFTNVRFWDEEADKDSAGVSSDGIQQQALFSLGQSHTSMVKMVSWSVDGHHLATASDSTVRIWNVSRSSPTASDPSSASPQLLHGHNATVHSVSFSPDGRYLASASDDSVHIWAVEEGIWLESEPPQVFLAPGTRFRCLTWSPDGRHIASGTGDAMVRIWKANENQSRAAAGSSSFSLHVILQAQMETNSTDFSDLGSINSLTWSPDGFLASASLDTTVRVWRFSEARVPEEPVPPSQVLEGQSELGLCSLASTRGRLAFATGDLAAVQVWDVMDSGTVDTASLRSLEGHSQPASSVAFSPDGRRLASAARDFTVRIWDVFNIAGMRRKVEDIRFFNWTLTESDLAQPGFPKLLLDFPAQPLPA